MRNTINYKRIGINLPASLIEYTDEVRGDIPRSKFIERCLETICGMGVAQDLMSMDDDDEVEKKAKK